MPKKVDLALMFKLLKCITFLVLLSFYYFMMESFFYSVTLKIGFCYYTVLQMVFFRLSLSLHCIRNYNMKGLRNMSRSASNIPYILFGTLLLCQAHTKNVLKQCQPTKDPVNAQM